MQKFLKCIKFRKADPALLTYIPQNDMTHKLNPLPGTKAKATGKITRIRYTAPERDYAIMEIYTSKKNLITITGPLAAFQIDDEIQITGTWQTTKYGPQIRVETCQTVLPTTLIGIQNFLASQIKGIGIRTAKKITEAFGDNTIHILDNEPHRLLEIKNISPNKLDTITQQWKEKQASRHTFIFLQNLGITYTLASKLYANYGEKIIPLLQHQPYTLAKQVDGIGFLKADAIAQKIGFQQDAPQRIIAAIDYTLYQTETNDGHCFLPIDLLIEQSAQILNLPESTVEKHLKEALSSHAFHTEITQQWGIIVYRTYMKNIENDVAKNIHRIASFPKTQDDTDHNTTIRQIENDLGIQLAQQQRNAVSTGLISKVLVITGGPGTGKTTLIKVFVAAAEKAQHNIFLAAPTGRAAKKLSETTTQNAKTLHRLLEYKFNESSNVGSFTKNQDNPLPIGTYIIDEASMIDLTLIRHLLNALPNEANIIFVGDIDQLPSVGAGTVLKDLINSKKIPVVTLTEIFRQAQQSLIVKNAHRINNGLYPETPPPAKEDEKPEEFYIINTSSPDHAEKIITQLISTKLQQRFNINPATDLQILSPQRKNDAGVNHLNEILQQLLNPNNEEIPHPYLKLKIGDRIMQLKNDYIKEVYNGDIGTVIKYEPLTKTLFLKFDDRILEYNNQEVENITLAYACTVHKSQGSEYPAVIALFLPQHAFMLQRNLVYTALTRAKKIAIFITNPYTLNKAIQNNTPADRYTLLDQKIATLFNNQNIPLT